jgi:hypothetical protein
MSRRQQLIAAILAACLVVGGVAVVLLRGGGSSAAAAGPLDVPELRPEAPVSLTVTVDLGVLTDQAEFVAVAGGDYPLTAGSGSVRQAGVDINDAAAGIAMAHDGSGHLLGTAPVWSLSGVTLSDVPVTCTSTAFGQLLMTPGLGRPDPMLVSLLWALANQPPTLPLLTSLGQQLCSGLADDLDHLKNPTGAESDLYGQALASLLQQLDQLAAQLPPVAESLADIPPGSLPEGPSGGPGAGSRRRAARRRAAHRRVVRRRPAVRRRHLPARRTCGLTPTGLQRRQRPRPGHRRPGRPGSRRFGWPLMSRRRAARRCRRSGGQAIRCLHCSCVRSGAVRSRPPTAAQRGL